MKKILKNLQTTITTKEYSILFFKSVLFTVVIYLVVSLCSGGRLLTSIFFLHTDDAFMDFFNSIRDAAQGVESYTVRQVIYPPMANLFFYLLSRFTPARYNNSVFENRYDWQSYPETVALIILFVAVCVLLLGLMVFFNLGKTHSVKKKLLIALAAVCSVPCLNMLERGNALILSLILLMVYALTYDSESRLVRELGLIALAFSFSFKLYPILFAWLLLGDKRYKEFFRCALYCVILLVLPSFFFGGPACLLTIVKNILSFSSYRTESAGGIFATKIVSVLQYLWFFLSALTFAVAPFVHRARWKCWAIGCIAFLTFPSLTSIYAWALFLIPLLAMFAEDMRGRENLWYFIPMLVPFLLFPLPLSYFVSTNTMLVYPALLLLSGYACYDTVKALLALHRKKGNEAQAS